MTTIDEVILKMDEIVEKCKQQNLRTGYFAILYRLVTIRIKQGIDDEEFEDNPRMETLDVIFALRFIEAFEAYYSQQPTTLSWKQAFDAVENDKLIIMQHLFLGINAHINLDLGIAAALTVQGKPLYGIHNDFNKINDILASLVDGVKLNISRVSILFGILIGLAKGKDEILLNFSIEIAREGAWKFAGEFYNSPDKEQCIRERDARIAILAGGLVNTGKWLSFLIRIIRFGEYKSIKHTMEILESAVEEEVKES